MVEMRDWMNDVDESDLPDSYRKLTDVIGMESTMKLVQNFSGDYLYVPKTDMLIKNMRDKDILKQYHKGYSVRHLSQIYDLSVVQIYEIIKRENAKQKAAKAIEE